jgi:two-component system NtrC family response regulator
MSARLLIVDDDEAIRTQMKWALANDYEIILAEDRVEAVEQFKSRRPAVTILDLGLPPSPNDATEGLAALTELLALDRSAKIIIISGQEEKENAIHAVGAGAFDFFCKPVDLNELRVLLRRCFHVAELEREYRQMQQDPRPEKFEGMLATCSPMQAVFASISKVAASSAPVLLLGESGTGKEMAAVAIHGRSPRKSGPFVAINCNAITETLFESELFGHEKGAFTGAAARHIGKFEQANRGTLFLDEIGDMSLPLQTRLLRVLAEGEFYRVGGQTPIRVDVRVIAATHQDLEKLIAQGRFREDLYYRLNVITIPMPPLRERSEDILELALFFLMRSAQKCGKRITHIDPEALAALERHRWPGNVRELENVIERAVVLAESDKVTLSDLPAEVARPGRLPTRVIETKPNGRRAAAGFPETAAANSLATDGAPAWERETLMDALRKCSGNKARAARLLGLPRSTYFSKLKKHGIR